MKRVNFISFFKPKIKFNIKSKYKIVLMQASSILGCSKAAVEKKFLYHQINIISDPLNLDKGLMEIRFKDVTVTYIINSQDICCTGYLFLDDISDLEKYLYICNKYFKTVALNSWKYKNGYIQLLEEDTDFYFLFHN